MDNFQPITSTVHNDHMVPVPAVSSIDASDPSLKPNELMRFPEQMVEYGSRAQTQRPGSSAIYMMPSYSSFQQFSVPNNELGGSGAMLSYPRPQQSQLLIKPGYPLSSRVTMPNIMIGQLEHRPWLNTSVPNKGNTQPQGTGFLASQQFLSQNKRTIQSQGGPLKAVLQKPSTPRGHPHQGLPSPKIQTDTIEPVRSKLRESIRAALDLVIIKDKSSSKGLVPANTKAIVSEVKPEASQSTEIGFPVSPAECALENSVKANIDGLTRVNSEKSKPSADVGQVSGSLQTHESAGQESNMIDALPDEESIAGQFFAKDDLMKGNGLSWVLDFDAWISETEGHDPKKQKVGEHLGGVQEVKKSSSPQNLAFQIELELFKLFGGVNKKYKEKGRSLLFNLKDRNNPELREKVMSGVISPARLCSMSAEELASKELSEWRIAKAEEFDQMKILPDSDIDIRRLVKKTHKGEFQVEVEEDDVSVEVSVGSSSIQRIQTEIKETISASAEISDGDKKETVIDRNNSDQNSQCTITISSNESSDLIIDDELKDTEFLPPIVSLDEFMESLHSEPPFENLDSDAAPAINPDNENIDVLSETKSAKLSPEADTSTASKTKENFDEVLKPDADIKPADNQQPKVTSSLTVTVKPKGENIWEGSLQLSLSASVAVTGFFKSGEKAPSKDWPRTIEIKGRVRLDAFEKFLQELYKSRSRHIMVVHMILKQQEGKDSEALGQVEDSYVTDDRVGFAEPLRGLEMYLCPFHPKILGRIEKHMAKDQTQALTLPPDDDKGLIAVVVWRKSHASPNTSSSHQKHSLKRHHHQEQQQQQYHHSRRHNHHQDRNMNVNSSNLSHKYPVPVTTPIVSSRTPVKAATQEADLPPGFGPPASQCDDDLPEFNFSGGGVGGLPRSAPSPNQTQPAHQMRQLVQKYGQNTRSAFVANDNDDDDDDIPEWQPMTPAPHQPTSHPQLDHSVLQHLINQQQQQQQQQLHRPPWQPLQPPMTVTQTNRPAVWLPPQQQQQQQSSVRLNPQQGHFHGAQSRGF